MDTIIVLNKSRQYWDEVPLKKFWIWFLKENQFSGHFLGIPTKYIYSSYIPLYNGCDYSSFSG